MIRAIRLELVKPLSETWDEAGPLLRTLAKATPKLLNAALDSRIAIEVAGRDAVKSKIAPDAKAASGDGLAYQAVLRAVERLRAWGEKKKHPFASLELPGGMSSAIARAASQAYARRDQQRPHFASERILVRATETALTTDQHGATLTLQLRSKGRVRFAVAGSWGTHRETLDAIAAGTIEHGDCKIQYDERRKKWYALLAYHAPEPSPASVDPRRVLAVHRGARNALYLLTSTGERGLPFPGSKLMAQRKHLSARMRDIKRTSELERGRGSKGHGRSRRYEAYSALEDKLARVTHTFCQQAAAFVSQTAERLGCALVLIEDYGGIVEQDADVRRVLDHGPLYQLKECVAHRMEKDGRALKEVPSAYISTKCPRCKALDSRAHNTRTGIFHCRGCEFERPADWVAAWWMLSLGGADMRVWEERLERERKLAERLRGRRAHEDGPHLDA
jgi:phage FluMu protein Com